MKRSTPVRYVINKVIEAEFETIARLKPQEAKTLHLHGSQMFSGKEMAEYIKDVEVRSLIVSTHLRKVEKARRQLDKSSDEFEKHRAGLETAIIIKTTSPNAVLRPPRSAEFLLSLMCSPDKLEEYLGDAEEAFHSLARQRSPAWARTWYYAHVGMLLLRGTWRVLLQLFQAWASSQAAR